MFALSFGHHFEKCAVGREGYYWPPLKVMVRKRKKLNAWWSSQRSGFARRWLDLSSKVLIFKHKFFLQGTHAISFIYSSLLNLSLISKKPTQQLITSEKVTFLSIESFGLLLQCAYPVSRMNDERMCWSQTKGNKSLGVINTCNLKYSIN